MGASAAAVTINLLANDSDSDGDPLSIYSIATPQLGTVQNLGAGTIQYSRPITVAGLDVFSYVVTDGKGGRAIGTVLIDRNTGANHPPVADSYSRTTIKETALAVPLIA